mgnify:CR=1 FL=1
MNNKYFYITTPIYYVNDKPHIGHFYTTLACDVMARFKRLSDHQTFFLTGTDEHGQKIEKSARNRNITPEELTDNFSRSFLELVNDANNTQNINKNLGNFSNDDFIRTTETRHKIAATALWNKLLDENYIYLDKYSGWYCIRDEAYYQESELIDGKAPTGADVEWVDFIYPNTRYNEVVNFVKSGLKDLSISRTTFNWGIKVPGNDTHVIYVWLDALTNYLTAIDYPNINSDKFKNYWPATHIVGKDILRFHAIYWPAFLMAANLPLPKKIIAHGWWTNEGQKISKSLGNVIDPIELINEFGLDQIRYFLLKEVPFGNDGNFSRENLISRVNADLANNIGNLAQRCLKMIHKNCAAKIPEFDLQPEDKELLNHVHNAELINNINKLIDDCRFNLILDEIINIATKTNEYIDLHAPWQLRKTDIKRMQTVLYCVCEMIRCIAILLQPFIPISARKLLELVGYNKENFPKYISFNYLNSEHSLKTGDILPAPEAIFPRINDK